jgi:TolA-binding protein
MATYKKVKSKKSNTNTNKSHSTTKEVFETLDVTASRSEQWIERNQKPIFIFLATVAVVILGYMGYNKYIQEPKETEASNELAFPRKYFEAALDGKTLDSQVKERDSLLVLGLEGSDGKYGFLDIAETYGGTKAGNLAEYYAGISYLKMRDYKNAIIHLGNFSSDDELLAPTAYGAIGDAFSEINQLEDAYEYYVKAANAKDNEFTTPMFLFKAGLTALDLGKNKKALKYFTRIEEDYRTSEYAKDIAYYKNKALFAAKK